ncbi:hypothetical protein WKW79_25100 [Variovorax robiniae]|uniref:DUF3592 domain-containing protein n=1 Tax=Variovorax robiniae TaxID=1836199 RepID=A0ABU8XE88_9BURK
MIKLYVVLAIIFGAIGIAVWFAFLRPVNQQTGYGTILNKDARAADKYVQHQPGASRGFRTPTEINIAESDVLEIALEGRAERVLYSTNTVASRVLGVGQRVRVTYVERSFGPLWHRTQVLDVQALEP